MGQGRGYECRFEGSFEAKVKARKVTSVAKRWYDNSILRFALAGLRTDGLKSADLG